MVVFKHSGNFNNTERFFKKASRLEIRRLLHKYGRKGVQALSASTPVRSDKTASSWGYEIDGSKGSYSITWTNSNINQGVPIAIIIQYGHGTGTGGYVQGRDYINPAISPIFDQILAEIDQEVKGL